jgi:CRP-like cAMP-binding protein
MLEETPLSPADRAFLRTLPMFAALNAVAFDDIASNARLLPARPKTLLFAELQPATDIYAVQSGWVKLYRTSSTQIEAIVSLLTRGATMGEAVTLLGTPYPASAETVTDCRLLRISGVHLKQLLKENPAMASGMMASMSRQLHQLVDEITRLKALSGAARVLDFLRQVNGGARLTTFSLPFEKQLLARHLSMQPESLSRTLLRLRKFGISVHGRTVTLASPDTLARAAAELSR